MRGGGEWGSGGGQQQRDYNQQQKFPEGGSSRDNSYRDEASNYPSYQPGQQVKSLN